jgi:uncharacterized protein YndB with AHSA1/START domain
MAKPGTLDNETATRGIPWKILTKELHTEIDINAPAERVWQLLTDFDSYPEWNPFIRWVRGYPQIGERLEVRIQPSGARGMTFRPTVRSVEPNRRLR